MAPFLDVGDVGRRAFPEVPVELLGDRYDGERAADGVVADPGLDGVHLADPAVAHQLAGQAIARVGALLAAGLEDAVVLAGRLDHRLAFLDGEREGLLAVDVAAGLHRGDRGQGVPVVDRADRDGVQVFLGEQLAEVFVFVAVFADLRRPLSCGGWRRGRRPRRT